MNDPITETVPVPETSAPENTAGQTAPGLKKSGKIFADSANTYDDQAKVAFDYFRRAAEKIIAEEDSINQQREQAENAIKAAAEEIETGHKLIKFWFWLIIPLLIGYLKIQNGKKIQAAKESELADLNQKFAGIKRDYQISKLDVAYVPIATEVPFDGKSFLLDDTGNAVKKDFVLTRINEHQAFLETMHNLQYKKDHTPVSEAGETPENIQAKNLVPSFEKVTMHDHLGGLDRDLRAASYFLNDVTKDSISLPIINPDDQYVNFLEKHCITDTENQPVLNVYNNDYSDDLQRFHEISQMQKQLSADGVPLDCVLEKFILELAEYVQLLGRTKIASISKLLHIGSETLLNSFKASYNHYSPELTKDEVERLQEENFDFQNQEGGSIKPFLLSSGCKVRYDAISGNWVANDGSRVATPLGIHQIQEEIISPLVQNLLQETRIERLRITNDIVNQKLNYIKEWQKEVDDFYGRGRSEGSDVINQMQLTLGEFTTAFSQYQTFQETEKSLISGDSDAISEMKVSENSQAAQIQVFQEQADNIEEKKKEFSDYVERLQEEIEQRAEEFRYTCDFEAKLRDGNSKDMVMSILNTDELDDRRKALLAANAYIAVNAQLPPEPVVNDQLYEKLAVDLNQVADQLLNQKPEEPEEPEEPEDIAPETEENSEAGEPESEDKEIDSSVEKTADSDSDSGEASGSDDELEDESDDDELEDDELEDESDDDESEDDELEDGAADLDEDDLDALLDGISDDDLDALLDSVTDDDETDKEN